MNSPANDVAVRDSGAMPRPQISVVIPVYRAEETVTAAIESVEAQGREDLEIIVVDDASPDNTVAVLRQFLKERPHVILIALDRNLGPAGARNRGIEAAHGEWIAFLDGDDAWLPWRIQSQLTALKQNPEAVLLCGDLHVEGVSGNGGAVTVSTAPGDATLRTRAITLEQFLDENPVATSTVLVRKTALAAAGGFDEQFRGPEDIDLWMRVCHVGQIVKLDVPLVRYREQPGSLSMAPETFLPQIVNVYRKAFGKGGALADYSQLKRRTFASRYVSAAWTFLACGRRGRALLCLLYSWWLWPLRIKVEQKHPLWRMAMLRNIILNRTRA